MALTKANSQSETQPEAQSQSLPQTQSLSECQPSERLVLECSSENMDSSESEGGETLIEERVTDDVAKEQGMNVCSMDTEEVPLNVSHILEIAPSVEEDEEKQFIDECAEEGKNVDVEERNVLMMSDHENSSGADTNEANTRETSVEGSNESAVGVLMSTSEDEGESLECKPDIESIVEYEKKKKIDLRKRRPQNNQDDEASLDNVEMDKSNDFLRQDTSGSSICHEDGDEEERLSMSSDIQDLAKVRSPEHPNNKKEAASPVEINYNILEESKSLSLYSEKMHHGGDFQQMEVGAQADPPKPLTPKSPAKVALTSVPGWVVLTPDGHNSALSISPVYTSSPGAEPEPSQQAPLTVLHEEGQALCKPSPPRRVLLEARSPVNSKQVSTKSDADGDADGDEDTRPNTEDEGVGGPNSSSNSLVVQHPLSSLQSQWRIMMERPENNMLLQTDQLFQASFQILSPRSVPSNESVFFGPMNKVKVNGRLQWVCDLCQKTYKSYPTVLEHIKGHYQVNAFFCPFCESSLKTKRNLVRHIKHANCQLTVAQRKDLLDGEDVEDLLDNDEDLAESESKDMEQEILNIKEEFEGNSSTDELEKELGMMETQHLEHPVPTDDQESEDEIPKHEDVDNEKPQNEPSSPPVCESSTSSHRRKRKRFSGMGTSTGSRCSWQSLKKAKLCFVDDENVHQIRSVHYKTLTEKLTTELAIVKYVRPERVGDRSNEMESEGDIKKELTDESEDDEDADVVSFQVESVGPVWQPLIDMAKPVLSQLRTVAKALPAVRPDQGPGLCFEFPSLLATPQLEPLVQTYLRLLDRPIQDLGLGQRQFADTMVTELVTGGVEELNQLIEMFKELVVELPGAGMEDWVEAVQGHIPCLAQAGLVDPSFSVQMFVVVSLVHCLLAV